MKTFVFRIVFSLVNYGKGRGQAHVIKTQRIRDRTFWIVQPGHSHNRFITISNSLFSPKSCIYILPLRFSISKDKLLEILVIVIEASIIRLFSAFFFFNALCVNAQEHSIELSSWCGI